MVSPGVRKRQARQGRAARWSRRLRSLANALVLLNATMPGGQLRRAVLVPPLRLVATVLDRWSRSWIGAVLGWDWTKAIFGSARRGDLRHHLVGDDWQAYQDGDIRHVPRKR